MERRYALLTQGIFKSGHDYVPKVDNKFSRSEQRGRKPDLRIVDLRVKGYFAP